MLKGQGAQTVAGCIHFPLRVTSIAQDVTYFAHDVILQHFFVGPTHDVKIELHTVI